MPTPYFTSDNQPKRKPGRKPGFQPTLSGTAPLFVNLDYRSKEGMRVTAIRNALTAHCGGAPTTAEQLIIERACFLGLKIVLMDLKIAEGTDTRIDGDQYLAWTSSFIKTVKSLGVKQEERAKSVEITDLLKIGKRGRAA